MVSTPERPGWYPAPDGRGEQWWNGASWSDGRRGVGGPSSAPASAAVPATPAVVRIPAPRPDPYAIVPAPVATRSSFSSNPGMLAFMLGIFGFFFPLVAPVAIIVGVMALRRVAAAAQPGSVAPAGVSGQPAAATSRALALSGLTMGIIATVVGVLELGFFVWLYVVAVSS